MGDLHALPEVIPDGWRPSFFAEEWVRVLPPEDWPLRVGQERTSLMVARTSNGYVPCGPEAGPAPRGIRDSPPEACAAAERAYCGCYVGKSYPKDQPCP